MRKHKREQVRKARNRVHSLNSRARQRAGIAAVIRGIVRYAGHAAVPQRSDLLQPRTPSPTNNQPRTTKAARLEANRAHAAASRRRTAVYKRQLLAVARAVVPPDELEAIMRIFKPKRPTTAASPSLSPSPPSPWSPPRSPPLFMQFGPDGGSDGQEPLPPSMPTSPTHCYSTPWGGWDDADLLVNPNERDMDLWFLAAPTTTTKNVVVEVDALGREL